MLVRVEFAAGRVSRTRFPPLGSDGPAAVIAGPGQVIVRPIGGVPGYLVPDGRPARTLPAALGQGGMSFPGPRPGQVWVTTGPGAQPVLSLVTMTGARAASRTGTMVRCRNSLPAARMPRMSMTTQVIAPNLSIW